MLHTIQIVRHLARVAHYCSRQAVTKLQSQMSGGGDLPHTDDQKAQHNSTFKVTP